MQERLYKQAANVSPSPTTGAGDGNGGALARSNGAGINLIAVSAKYIILYPLLNMPEPLSIGPEQLVNLLQSKSREAFSILYDSYADALFGTICRMVNNKVAAEDLLQDVFVKIWKKIDSYDPARGTLFTWMINIARNICIDYLRSKQYKQQLKVVENGFEHGEISASPSLEPNYNIANVELLAVTQKLEVKHRQVIEMVYFRGYTHEEVAQILNIPVGTVKTRSRAGLKQLRSLYN
jgi:RNA polymerase sigma factor (sigma-70 family)